MDGKSRILLVDDNISLCKSMSFILKRKGYEVALAKDGPEAIAMAGENPYDMIFMDIKMPIMDGAETHNRIKQIQPGTTVLMMTAYADEELIERALVEGAYGIVHKPLEIEKILSMIETATTPVPGISALLVAEEIESTGKLKKLLSRNNNIVELARSGEVAATLESDRYYDIAFVDMGLEGADVMEIIHAIREKGPDTAIILMTERRKELAELAENALRETAYTCLYKPLDMEKVLGLVSEIVGSIKKEAIQPGSH